MPRKFQHRRMGIYSDSSVRREEEKVERFLEDVSARGTAFEKANVPGAVVRVTPDGGDGGLRDHDHSRSGLGGNTLGDPSKTITARGTWEHAGRIGMNKLAPLDRLHIVIPDAAVEVAIPDATPDSPLNWHTQAGAGNVDLHNSLKDDLDSTFIQNDGLNASTCRVTLDDKIAPTVDTGHVVRFRMSRDTSATDNQNVTWNLEQGVTSKASSTISLVGVNVATPFSITLTEAEAASITVYTDLRFTFSAGGTGGQAGPRIYKAQFDTPKVTPGGGIERAIVVEAGAGQRLSGTNIFDMLDEDGKNLLKLGPSSTLTVGANDGKDAIRLDLQSLTAQTANIAQAVDAASTTLFSLSGAGQWTLGATSGMDAVTRFRIDAGAGQSVDMFQNFAAGVKTVFIDKDGIFNLVGSFVIDHGGLGGLADDDHTQYLLLAGRSGGQIAIGGTASGDDLTLQSTSNATRGDIIFGSAGGSRYLETSDRFAFNRTTALAPVHADAESTLIPASKFEGNFGGTTGQDEGPVVVIESTRDDPITNGTSGNVALKVTLTQNTVFGTKVSAAISAITVMTPDPFFTSGESVGGFKFLAQSAGSSNINGTLFGAQGRVDHLGSGLLASLTGFDAILAGNSGNITDSIGLNVFGIYSTNPTVTRHVGVRVRNPTAAFGAVITETRGIWLENLASATTNWAIYSEGADSWFQDRLRTSAALRLIEAGGGPEADHIEIKAPSTVGTSYGIELDDNGPSSDAIAKYAALSGAVTAQTYVPIPTGTAWLPAGEWLVVASSNVAEETQGAANEQYAMLTLSPDNLDGEICAYWLVPDDYKAGTTMIAKIFWAVSAPAAQSWFAELKSIAVAAGELLDGVSAKAQINPSANVTADDLQITTAPGTIAAPSAGEVIKFLLDRDVDNVGDDFGAGVHFIGLKLEYTRSI